MNQSIVTEETVSRIRYLSLIKGIHSKVKVSIFRNPLLLAQCNTRVTSIVGTLFLFVCEKLLKLIEIKIILSMPYFVLYL